MKRILHLLAILSIFGLNFTTDDAYAQAPAIRLNGAVFGQGDNTTFCPTKGTNGKGTIDDTAALNTCFASTGRVVVANGTYKVTAPLVVGTGVTEVVFQNVILDASTFTSAVTNGYAQGVLTNYVKTTVDNTGLTPTQRRAAVNQTFGISGNVTVQGTFDLVANYSLFGGLLSALYTDAYAKTYASYAGEDTTIAQAVYSFDFILPTGRYSGLTSSHMPGGLRVRSSQNARFEDISVQFAHCGVFVDTGAVWGFAGYENPELKINRLWLAQLVFGIDVKDQTNTIMDNITVAYASKAGDFFGPTYNQTTNDIRHVHFEPVRQGFTFYRTTAFLQSIFDASSAEWDPANSVPLNIDPTTKDIINAPYASGGNGRAAVLDISQVQAFVNTNSVSSGRVTLNNVSHYQDITASSIMGGKAKTPEVGTLSQLAFMKNSTCTTVETTTYDIDRKKEAEFSCTGRLPTISPLRGIYANKGDVVELTYQFQYNASDGSALLMPMVEVVKSDGTFEYNYVTGASANFPNYLNVPNTSGAWFSQFWYYTVQNDGVIISPLGSITPIDSTSAPYTGDGAAFTTGDTFILVGNAVQSRLPATPTFASLTGFAFNATQQSTNQYKLKSGAASGDYTQYLHHPSVLFPTDPTSLNITNAAITGTFLVKDITLRVNGRSVPTNMVTPVVGSLGGRYSLGDHVFDGATLRMFYWIGSGFQAIGDVLQSGSYANPTWITSIAGSKVSGNITQQAGAGQTGAVPITLFSNATAVSSVTSGTTDAQVYTMPANTLNTNGQHIRCEAGFLHGATANAATFALVLGGTNLYTNTRSVSGEIEEVSATFTRTSSTTGRELGAVSLGGSAASPATNFTGLDFTSPIIIKTTVTGATANGDMQAIYMWCEGWPN